MTENLLITGGCGFIGSHFIRLLLKNTNVSITNIDALTYASNKENTEDFENNPNYRFIKVDITKKDELDKVFDQTYDMIINFAAETHVDRSIENSHSFVHTNVLGTYYLLQKVLDGKAKKMLQISTDEVYGSLKVNEHPFKETHPLSPNNPYSASKASADLLIHSFYRTYKIPVMITRCSNNYGPNQNSEKLIPKVIFHALHDKKIPIYGDGQNVRDWLFVEDHCKAIYTIMVNGKPGEIYNIGGSNEKSNIEIVKIILNYIGKSHDLIAFVTDRKGHDRRYGIDWSKMKNGFNWQPNTPFNRGIKMTIDWYMNHQDWFHTSSNVEQV
ncbi:dTDP-glucose 4,6-dehydratase [Bacillus sp. NPDC077411]|uniref:dTDP-glucose 4,6-dehydratase n=1 Tax=Bacillus bruguierae TaxID=3127667 RepID=A0ABU8FFK2_9BACI